MYSQNTTEGAFFDVVIGVLQSLITEKIMLVTLIYLTNENNLFIRDNCLVYYNKSSSHSYFIEVFLKVEL